MTHPTGDTRTRREWWPATLLFLFAMAVFIAREPDRLGEAAMLASAAVFAGLTSLTMALSVTACRERLRAGARPSTLWRCR